MTRCLLRLAKSWTACDADFLHRGARVTLLYAPRSGPTSIAEGGVNVAIVQHRGTTFPRSPATWRVCEAAKAEDVDGDCRQRYSPPKPHAVLRRRVATFPRLPL